VSRTEVVKEAASVFLFDQSDEPTEAAKSAILFIITVAAFCKSYMLYTMSRQFQEFKYSTKYVQIANLCTLVRRYRDDFWSNRAYLRHWRIL